MVLCRSSYNPSLLDKETEETIKSFRCFTIFLRVKLGQGNTNTNAPLRNTLGIRLYFSWEISNKGIGIMYREERAGFLLAAEGDNFFSKHSFQ